MEVKVRNITIHKYTDDKKDIWNSFNENAKNGLFMFDRNYMEYHSDRYEDHSLLFYEDDKLVAILPANKKGKSLYSHQGLTYGGLVTDDHMKQHVMNRCVEDLIRYMQANDMLELTYKAVPHIYHTIMAEEDIYALCFFGARLIKVEPSTSIKLQTIPKLPKGRKAQIARAKREGLLIRKTHEKKDYQQFFDIESYVLKKYHNLSPTHTADEMILLRERFPQNIHLYVAELNGAMLGGVVVYEYHRAIHTQYMAADEKGRELGALDLAVITIIEEYKNSKTFLDFGISSESDGRVLNEGLISQKESFGGRTLVYETFGLSTSDMTT